MVGEVLNALGRMGRLYNLLEDFEKERDLFEERSDVAADLKRLRDRYLEQDERHDRKTGVSATLLPSACFSPQLCYYRDNHIRREEP